MGFCGKGNVMKKNHRKLFVFGLLGAIVVLPGCAKPSAPTQANTGAPQTAAPVANSQTFQSGQQSGGVIQNTRQAVKRVVDESMLRNLALAYFQYFSLNGRGPSAAQDIADSLTPKMLEQLKDTELYVVNWKLANVSGNTVIAYVKEPDIYGTRIVAKGDGSVTRMNKEDFEKAKAGR
jgi:hypothetical protein